MAQNRLDTSALPISLAYRSGVNFVTETGDRRTISGSAAWSVLTGQIRATAAPIIEGDTISQLWGFVTAPGTGCTNFTLAVYDRNLNLVAQTADRSGALGTNIWVGGPLNTVWQAPYTGIVYLGIYSIAGTTQPTVMSCNAATGSGESPVSGIARTNWFQSNVTLPTVAVPQGPVASTAYVLAA